MSNTNASLKIPVLADLTQMRAEMAKVEAILGTTASAMKTASNAFDGAKVVAAANAALLAVQNMGGVTKLTAAEQAKLNATLALGIEKYKALGHDAPQAMLAMADATKQAKSGMADLLSSAGKVAAGLGVAFGATAIIGGIKNMITGVMETADHVHDLAEKLDVSTDAVQRWTYAAKQTGADMSNVSISLGFMNKTLAGGDASTVAALASAGLQFKTIRAMAPEQAFETIAQAIKQIPDPMTQARVATELFGKSGQDLLPAIKEGLIDIGREAPLMSKATIDALEKAGDAIDRFWANVHTRVGTSLGTIALTIEELGKGWEGLANLKAVGLFNTDEEFIRKLTAIREAQNALTEETKHTIEASVKAGESNELLRIGLSGTQEAIDAYANSLRKAGQALPQISFGAELQAAQAAYAALTSAKKADIEAGFKLGTNEADIAKRMDLTAAVLAVAKKAYDDHKTAVSKASAEAQKFGDAMAELNAVGEGWAGTLDTIDGNVVEAIKFYLAAGVEQGKLAIAYALTGAQVKAVDAAMKDHIEALKTADGITKLFTTEGDKHFKEWFASVAKSLDETNKKVVSTFEGFLKAQKDYHEAVAKDTLDADDFQRFMLQQQLDDAKVKLNELGEAYRSTYDEIAKTVAVKLSEIGTLWKESEHQMIPPGLGKSVGSVTTEIQRLQDAFTKLGQTVGGTFGAMLTGASQIAGLFSAANQAQANYNANPTEQNKKALDQAKSNRTWGTVGIAAGLVAQTINTGAGAPTKNLVASGALQGAAAGSAFGPWGTAVGAGVGALVGWWQSGAEWRKAFSDISRDFGNLHVPEDFAKTIEQIESDTGLKRAQAITSQLDQLIKFAGGLNPGNLELFAGKLHDAFSYIEQGSMSVAQVSQVLDKTFADFASAGTDAYGRINDTIREMIDLDQRFGTQSKTIMQWMQGQAANMAGGLSDLLTQPLIESASAVGKALSDAQAAVDKQKDAIDDAVKGSSQWKTATDELAKAQDVLTAALSTQHGESERNKQSLDDLGFAAVTAFNAAIASGQTFAQALQGISPQLSTIEKAYKDLGLAIDDAALKGLTLENTILNGPGGVGKAIGGLQAIVTAGTNLGKGVETPEAFAAQQRTLASLYTQTQAATAAAGGDTINALLPFQATLHQLEDWAKKNGLQLDADTQEKIRQSQELNIWNDDFKTDAEKTRQSIADLIASNDVLVRALGGAAAAASGADGTGTPGSGYWNPSGSLDPTGGLLHPPIPIQMASGGFGFATGPMMFSTKGNEEYAFSGEGKRFQRQDADAGPSIIFAPNVTFNMSAVRPDTLADLVEHEIGPQFISMCEDRLRDFQPRMVNALRPGK